MNKQERDKILELVSPEMKGYQGAQKSWNILKQILNALTTEDERAWLSEAGFCGTCAYFHREPMCPGGICGYYSDKPQVKLNDSCEEYETAKDWEAHFANNTEDDTCICDYLADNEEVPNGIKNQIAKRKWIEYMEYGQVFDGSKVLTFPEWLQED